MSNEANYDLIGDYPYEDIDNKFAGEFLRLMVEPRDIKAAGVRLVDKMNPYPKGLKANQIDVAVAVRDVLKFPTYSKDEVLRHKSRDLISNLVKKAADENNGKVDGEKIIQFMISLKNQIL